VEIPSKARVVFSLHIYLSGPIFQIESYSKGANPTKVRIEGLTFTEDGLNPSISIRPTNFSALSVSEVTVQNCFWHNISSQNIIHYGSLVELDASSINITQCRFENIMIYNDLSSPPRNAVLMLKVGSKLSIADCVFENNSVTVSHPLGDGSPVFVDAQYGNVSFDRVTFRNQSLISSSTLRRGGAITMISQKFFIPIGTFKDSYFIGNSMGSSRMGSGGALVALSFDSINLENCVFQGNFVEVHNNSPKQIEDSFGGAVYSELMTGFFIKDSIFQSNGIRVSSSVQSRHTRSRAFGGAIASVPMDKWSEYFDVTNTTFLRNFIEVECKGGTAFINEIDAGGAIYLLTPFIIRIIQSNFTLNALTVCHRGYGGAISIADGPRGRYLWKIDGTFFTENWIHIDKRGVSLPESEGSGGAIHVSQSPVDGNISFDVHNCTFQSNAVKTIDSHDVWESKSGEQCLGLETIVNGGAIATPTINLWETNFILNYVKGPLSLGGALLISTPTSSLINNTSFDQNMAFSPVPIERAQDFGGAIYITVREIS
jgi:hypothetical protein